MAQDVIMPQMGESIAEGTVTTWLKKVGDTVERDEPLFEISTDKVDAEIPSPSAGVLLEIKVQPGETVPINTVVAVIGEAGESAGKAAPKAPEKKAEKAPEPKAEAQAPKSQGDKAEPAPPPKKALPQAQERKEASGTGDVDELRRQKSSPVVRKIAAENNVDISQLEGSGISGRVTKQDILGHLEGGGSGGQSAPKQAAQAGQGGQSRQSAPSGGGGHESPLHVPDAYRGRAFEGDKVEDMSMMRSKIAEHMVMSKRISPHVGTFWEMDFHLVSKLRAKYKAVWEERFGVNLTYTSFIMKATVDALKAFPTLNASIDGNKVIYHSHVNLGIAVALDWGLIVPVVHSADELNLLGLARRSVDLATRARNKKLKPDEVQGGTFTITNPGIYGPMFGFPVINQPQVGILGVGAVEKRPVVIDDSIAIRTRAYLSMAFDHRLVDGAVADQFMARIKKGIEEFDEGELA